MGMKKWLAGVVAVLSGLALVPSAGATVITVDTTVDGFGGTNCSLRNAFISADDDNPAGTCPRGDGDDVVLVPGGHYKLTLGGAGEKRGLTGDLDVIGAGSLTIRPAGPGEKVTIDGIGSDRIFDHVDENAGPLILENISLVGGHSEGSDQNGGAIRHSVGILELDGVTISGSDTTGDGGAIHTSGSSTLKMLNSTVSGNNANGSGGGVYVGGSASADLRSITVAGNGADENTDGLGGGGGIATGTGSVGLVNSILADNTDKSPEPFTSEPDCQSGPSFMPRFVISTQALGAGNCLIGFDPGSLTSPADAQVGALADNGGRTPTVSIGPGSPAIDAAGSVAPDLCPPVDQRGVTRPAGSCDLGAFEFDPNGAPPLPLPGIARPSTTTASFDGTNLYLMIVCPSKFKPKCSIEATPVTARSNGKPMANTVKATVASGKQKFVKFTVKSAIREKVEAMTFQASAKLILKLRIKSKKVGKRKAKKPATVFRSLKVRNRI